jgi:membrane protein DedA with SNARE-associated domain
MVHELLKTWFHWVDAWGYAGVFVLMALESSIIPVPSEIVMPPAAFWAAQGRMNFGLVVLAGTLGSYFGSVLNYVFFQWIGAPAAKRYGKFVLISPEKLDAAERWVRSYGSPGVFLARLLPVFRHLISIPAGILEMPFKAFSVATLAGAGLWCLVLSWFGQEVLGSRPDLLESPEAMISAIKAKLVFFVAAALGMTALYVCFLVVKKKSAVQTAKA